MFYCTVNCVVIFNVRMDILCLFTVIDGTEQQKKATTTIMLQHHKSMSLAKYFMARILIGKLQIKKKPPQQQQVIHR